MNTERTEKFVNAIACDLEEGGFRQVSGTTLRRTLATAVSAALPLLAEQQGDALVTDEMVEAAKRAMYFHCQPDATEGEYLDDKEEGDALAPAFRAALHAALAATGKQQVGEVLIQRPVAPHAANNAPSPTIRMQVGEVQGDAHVVVLREMRARLNDAGSPARTAALDAAIAALAARQPVGQEPIELSGIADALSEGRGFWRTCSGCHESNEGVPTGPYSRVMKCHLGTGCSECGGVGAIWDDTDYQAWSDQMAQSLAAQPAQGIDLGQFRGWLCTTTDGVATDWTMEEDSRARFERMGRSIEPVFATGPDDQRDAAPGVGE